MAGSTRSWLALGVLIGAALAQPSACKRPTAADSPLEGKVAAALLADTWPEVIQPALAQARADADLLSVALEAWADAERNGAADADAAREAAREAWFLAMESWQVVEPMQIGPAAPSLSAVSGLDLRDAVYSYPTINRCRVDQNMVDRTFEQPDFFEAELVISKGLDALETVLFSDDQTNDCPSLALINTEGTFDALGVQGVRENRSEYGRLLARQIVADLDAIEAAWTGGFDVAFEEAGAGASPFASRGEAVNAVFDALFYVETVTKDIKLAEPLGLIDCGLESCPSETALAGGSDRWIRANLAGYRALFTGGEGTGLDDLLVDAGHDDVAAQMLDALDRAEAAADALNDEVSADPTAAEAVHVELSAVATLLKGDVATVLFLQIPGEAAGDND